MRYVILIFCCALLARAETVLVYDENNGADIASVRTDVLPLYLPSGANQSETSDLAQWRALGIQNRPPPPALVDVETGISVPVTLETLADATNALAALVDAAFQDSPAATDDGAITWRELRGTNHLLKIDAQTRKDAYEVDRTTATNRLATTNWSNTNQVRLVSVALQNEIEDIQKQIGVLREQQRLGWKVEQFLSQVRKGNK